MSRRRSRLHECTPCLSIPSASPCRRQAKIERAQIVLDRSQPGLPGSSSWRRQCLVGPKVMPIYIAQDVALHIRHRLHRQATSLCELCLHSPILCGPWHTLRKLVQYKKLVSCLCQNLMQVHARFLYKLVLNKAAFHSAQGSEKLRDHRAHPVPFVCPGLPLSAW